MAIGTLFKVNNVSGFTTPAGSKFLGSDRILTCFFSISPTSLNYNSTNNALVEDLSSDIANFTNNGKKPYLLDIGFVAPGREGSTLIGAMNFTVNVARNGFTFELTSTDLITERASGTMSQFTEDICLMATYSETSP